MLISRKISAQTLAWQGIIFWSVTFNAFEAPFSYVFKTEVNPWQLYVDGILAIVFLIDSITHFRKIHLSKSKIGAVILFDVLNCLPYELLSYGFGIPRIFKILYVFRLIKMLHLVKLYTFSSGVTVVPKIVKIQMMTVLSLIAVHWVSCGWIFIHPATEGLSRNDYYIKCLYWTVTTLTTIGYGDITPSTTVGRLYTMVIMILGVGVYGIVIGNVTRMMAEADRFKEKAREKLGDLSNFMKYYEVPQRLQSTVFSYYEHLLTKRLSDNDTRIIAELPHALQHELQTYMNIRLIKGIPIFANCSPDCLRSVASALEQHYYSPGQTVINIGEIGHEMFIIGHGKADIILEDGNVVATLGQGQFFGELALLKEIKRTANVRANGYCDLYKLRKEDFLNIIKSHPVLMKNIEEIASERMKKN